MTPQEAFDEYHQAVYSFAYRLTRHEDLAEDITQECFLVLVRAPQRFDPERGSIKTYLFSIARNLALKQYRNQISEALLPDDLSDLGPADTPDIVSAVEEAVARLPHLQQEAIILFEYEGATLEEVAEIVGADTGTVKSRLHRAREGLRRALAPYRKAGKTHGTV